MNPTQLSVPHLFLHRVAESSDQVAFTYPDANEQWLKLSWADTRDRVESIARALRARGLDDEQRVGILSTTRIEWILADLGILCAGGATTTIYPSNTPKECAYILKDSDTRVLFAEDDGQVQKIREVREELPNLGLVIVFSGRGDGKFVISLEDLEAEGLALAKADEADAFQAVIDRITPDRLATLIYTSGTTGQPKGVELTHDCWLYEGEAMEKTGVFLPDDLQFLWLPMSHSMGKVLEIACLQIGFTTAVDGRIPRIVDNLTIIRPTFMAAAPRIFEKVYNRVVTGAEDAGGLKLKIFKWSLGIGRQASQLRQNGKEPSGLLALQNAIADKLVFSKLRARFGGRVRYFISGSAPLSREMAEFFHACNILICEGYGLTESSAASFVNLPTKFKFGTVGPALPGTEVRIDPGTGEILMRGRGIMRGYHNLPEQTAETLDADGWLHTGDVGEMDDDGMLRITDRIKDLIKTSGGKYVAPQEIEGKLKAACPYLEHVLVHGNARNFCSALVTLDADSMAAMPAGGDIAVLLKAAVDQVNATMPSYATLKKYAIVADAFTVEGGELTPSLKVKRKVVEAKHAEVLTGFYKGALKSV